MTKQAKATGKCLGEEFFINDYWQFEVPSLDRHYKTYDDMKSAIERLQAAKKAAERKRPIAIPCITDQRQRVIVTSIHAGHGHLVCKPKVDGSYRTFYVDVPWIMGALEEMARLNARERHIREALKRFSINGRSPYGFSVDQLAERTAQVVGAAEKALKAAEKTNLDDALARTDPPKKCDFD